MVGEILFGLDVAYINDIVEQLVNDETVKVLGCNDPDGFMEYLSEERNLECDCLDKERYLQIIPFTGDWGIDNYWGVNDLHLY